MILDHLIRFVVSVKRNLVGALVAALLLALAIISAFTIQWLSLEFKRVFPSRVVEQSAFERITIARVATQAELAAILTVAGADRALLLRLTNGLVDLSGLPVTSVTLDGAVVAPGVSMADRFFTPLPSGIYSEAFVAVFERRCVWLDTAAIREPALRSIMVDRGTQRSIFCPLIRGSGQVMGLISLEWLNANNARQDVTAPLQSASVRISDHLAQTAFR